MTDPEDLVATYWEHHRLARSSVRAERLRSEATRWAWDEVDEIVDRGGDDLVPLLIALADAAPDEEALAYLGAGPIEDAVRAGSAKLIDRIEGAAERSEQFRFALRAACASRVLASQRTTRMTTADITAGLNAEDDTGYVWTFLDEARDRR